MTGTWNGGPSSTEGPDIYTGDGSNDVANGQGGNDILYGNAGNDSLLGGAGSDTLFGGDGDDYLEEQHGDGTVTIDGGAGNDGVHFELFVAGNPFATGTIDGGADVDEFFVWGTLTGLVITNMEILNTGAHFVIATAAQFEGFEIIRRDLAMSGSLDLRLAAAGALDLSSEVGAQAVIFTGTNTDDGFISGSGNDTLNAGNGANTMDGGGGNDQITTGTGADTLIGGDGNDTLISGNGNNTLDGGSGDDALSGGDDADTFIGGAGNDTMVGGAGGFDTLTYAAALAGVTVNLGTGAAQNTIGAGIDTIAQMEILIGSAFADALTGVAHSAFGGAGNDAIGGGGNLFGEDGNDTLTGLGGVGSFGSVLDGGAGDDTISGGVNNMTLNGGAGIDALNGGVGNETLNGGSDNDTLIGGIGNDTLDGGAGNDSIDGGASTDTLTYATVGAGVHVNLSVTIAQNTIGSGVDTVAGIENVVGSAFNDQFTGTDGVNMIYGGAGNDVLTGDFHTGTLGTADSIAGGDGNDAINGGGGNDLIDAGAGDDVISIWGIEGASVGGVFDVINGGADFDTLRINGLNPDAGAAQDWVTVNSSYISNIERITFGTTFTSNLTLNVIGTLSPTLNIVGSGAIDTIEFEDTAMDLRAWTFSSWNASVDRIVIHHLGYSPATLIYGSVMSDILDTGGGQLNGWDGNDLIYSSANNDTINGGNGVDTITYVNAAALVTVNLSQFTAQNTGGGTDSITQVENLTGSAFNDTLTGTTGDNVLDGGAGADAMNGGDGNDIYVFDDVGDSITDSSGVDTVRSSLSITLGPSIIENVTLTGATNANATGNSSANVLTGNAGANSLFGLSGADTLDGGTGADTMRGGGGNDIYVVDNIGDVTTESSVAGGLDRVQSSLTRTLGANLENLTLTGADLINGTGNALNNVLIGNNAANTLSGLASADRLIGGAGGDRLIGGAGLDVLTGNSGADKFVFNTAPAAADRDTITDYNVAADTIQIEDAVFVGIGGAGVLAAAAFRIGASPLDANDRIIYNSATGALYFDADGLGGAAQTQFATLSAGLALTAADFVVI